MNRRPIGVTETTRHRGARSRLGATRWRQDPWNGKIVSTLSFVYICVFRRPKLCVDD